MGTKLDTKMESNWTQIDTKLGTKMGPKWNQNGTKMGTKMGPKWSQNGTKMGPQGTPRGPPWDVAPGPPKSGESVELSSKTGRATLVPAASATRFLDPLRDSLKNPTRTL